MSNNSANKNNPLSKGSIHINILLLHKNGAHKRHVVKAMH